MDENTATELEQHVVEYGDAKQLTMGIPSKFTGEENPVAPWWIEG